jgi:hypothetical protein
MAQKIKRIDPAETKEKIKIQKTTSSILDFTKQKDIQKEEKT